MPVSFFFGVLDHLWHLLALRHDGRGVPSALTPALVMLIGLDLLIRTGLAWIQGIPPPLQLAWHLAQLACVFVFARLLLKRNNAALVLLSVFVLMQLAFSIIWAAVMIVVLPVPDLVQRGIHFWALLTLMINLTMVTKRLIGESE